VVEGQAHLLPGAGSLAGSSTGDRHTRRGILQVVANGRAECWARSRLRSCAPTDETKATKTMQNRSVEMRIVSPIAERFTNNTLPCSPMVEPDSR
jgi:hypothetical protein